MEGKLFIAGSAEEAVNAKDFESVYLAGGTEINRLGSSVSGNSYISIRRTPSLHGIIETDGTVTIGSACTFQELVDSDLTPAYLKEALLFLASRTRRNMSTIGGNIALCRDDSFVIPTLIAADATLELLTKEGSSSVTIKDYVSSKANGCSESKSKSDIPEDALIVNIKVPAHANVVSKRYANTAQSHARLTVAMGLIDGKFSPACAIKNNGIHIMNVIGSALDSNQYMSEEELIDMVKGCDGLKLEDDLIYGGAEYRKYLLGVTISMLRDQIQNNEKEGGTL